MNVPFYRCEDCGHEFDKTELLPDVEDDLVACPECGGLDIQLVTAPETLTGAVKGGGRRRGLWWDWS